MERDLTCFEWQNRAAEFIDGSLPVDEATRASRHLQACEECRTRESRFRMLLEAIQKQHRARLPEAVRRSPLAGPLPRMDLSGGRSRWQGLPWYVRTGIEGLAVASTVLFIVAMVPRLRALYEESVERKVQAILLSEPGLGEGGTRQDIPLARGRKAADATTDPQEEFTGGEEDDSDESPTTAEAPAADESADTPGAPDVRVGNSEIWRFHVKSDSPREFRPRIVAVLSEAGIPPDTAGFGGVEAPGGIQFDLLVSKEFVGPLKTALEKLAPSASEDSAQTVSARARPFTWYKNRSRRQIPGGKARVVIWLSQF